jgi:hypothetical protein
VLAAFGITTARRGPARDADVEGPDVRPVTD